MSNEANLTVADRIEQLMQYLRIAKAHFAGRTADWAGSAIAHPEKILSLTLVFPPAIPQQALSKMASKTLVLNGDRGPFAESVKHLAEATPGTTLVTMPDYAGLLWDDVWNLPDMVDSRYDLDCRFFGGI